MDPSPAEQAEAAAIVEWVLGIEARPPALDHGYDFDLIDGATPVGVLQVVHAGPSADPLGFRVICGAAELERSWLLGVSPGTDVRSRQPELRTLLRRMEWCGAVWFGPLAGDPPDGEDARPIVDALGALGVVAGVGVDVGEDPPGVRVTSSIGGIGWSSHVNEVVETEAWRLDARRRLQGALGDRHLFVWIDGSDLHARSAMEADSPPARPALPVEATCAWACRRAAGDSPLLADRVWQTDEAGEWQVLGPIRKAVASRRHPAVHA